MDEEIEIIPKITSKITKLNSYNYNYNFYRYFYLSDVLNHIIFIIHYKMMRIHNVKENSKRILD